MGALPSASSARSNERKSCGKENMIALIVGAALVVFGLILIFIQVAPDSKSNDCIGKANERARAVEEAPQQRSERLKKRLETALQDTGDMPKQGCCSASLCDIVSGMCFPRFG